MKQKATWLIVLLLAMVMSCCAVAMAEDTDVEVPEEDGHKHFVLCRYPGVCFECRIPLKGVSAYHLDADLTTKNNGDGTHTSTCRNCLASWNDWHYAYCDDATQSACTLCGASGSVIVKHNPSYLKIEDQKDGTHVTSCDKCGRHFEAEAHWASCANAVTDVCQDCGAAITAENLVHGKTKYQSVDGQTHAIVCKQCNAVEYTEQHYTYCGATADICFACHEKGVTTSIVHYDQYTDNGDGTHTRTCKRCDMAEVSAHFAWCDEEARVCGSCGGKGKMETRHDYENGVCSRCGDKEPVVELMNGLNVADGYYYINGKKALDYTGMVEYNGGQFLVTNGKLDTSVNGLKLVDGKFLYLAEGQLQVYKGLAEYDGEWFYLDGGELDLNATGLYQYGGKTFLVAVGRLVSEYTGLAEVPGGDWYFVTEGRVRTDYTGSYVWNGSTFNIQNGKVVW